VPGTDLIDDLSPEQKQAAQARTATKKVASLIPDNLADALAQALHNSPGILVAEAKVREAQAELNEVRQSVVHDLTITYSRLSLNKKVLQGADSFAIPAQRVLEAEHETHEDDAKIIFLMGVGVNARGAAEANDGGHSVGMMGPMGSGAMATGRMGPMSPMGMGPMSPMGMGPGAMGPGGMKAGGMSPMGQGMSMMGSGPRKRASKEHEEEAVDDLKQFSNLPEKMRRFLESRVER
jgi:hypothetical protein